MIPLFSRRSILVLILGFAVGIAIGFGYWSISPVAFQTTWPPIKQIDTPPLRYNSSVTLGFTSSDESSQSIRALEVEIERQVVQLNSFPFLKFLNEQLSNPTPIYPRTIAELDKMISVTYRFREDERPKIFVDVTSEDSDEAYYIAGSISLALQDYSRQEQTLALQEKYIENLTEMLEIEADLLKATEELRNINQQIGQYDLNLNPNYIIAEAKLVSLDSELSVAVSRLGSLMGTGINSGEQYESTVAEIDRLGIALAELRSQVAGMEAQVEAMKATLNVKYDVASTKVEAMNNRLQELSQILALSSAEPDSDLEVPGSVLVDGPTIPIDPENPPAKPQLKPSGRMTLLQGAGAGLVIAWLVMNRRWVLERLGMSSKAAPREEEEDEEE